MKKKTISIILTLCLILSFITTSFASPQGQLVEPEIITVNYDKNSVVVKEGKQLNEISIQETANGIITSIKNLNTGDVDYLIRDESAGTIYSSITGETISIIDEESHTPQDYQPTSLPTYRIYTRDLVAAIGYTSSVTALVAAIATFQGNLFVGGLAGLLTAAGIFGTTWLNHNIPNGYLSITTKYREVCKVQAGRRICVITNQLTVDKVRAVK